ncbi:MAG: hypothetical protein MJ054_02185 [Clostridia bacterium]|nr:hypothetical protein [Clostridia bacterium]
MNSLEECYFSLGFNAEQVKKLITNCNLRDENLIKQKFEKYLEIFQISKSKLVKLIDRDYRLLTRDVLGDGITSVKNKIKVFQHILQADEETVIKAIVSQPSLLGYDCTLDSEKFIKGKIQKYKNFFQVDEMDVFKLVQKNPVLLILDCDSDEPTSVKTKIREIQNIFNIEPKRVCKMIKAQPKIITYDCVGDTSTSITAKIKAYQTLLQADELSVKSMIIKQPALLSFDCVSNSPTSVKSKIKKMSEVITQEKACELILEKPNVLNVPARDFKIRYILAVCLGESNQFFKGGFMTNQNKVWARSCCINDKNKELISGKRIYAGIYKSEKAFQKRFGQKSAELLNEYPFNQDALLSVVQQYDKIKDNHNSDKQDILIKGTEK